MSYHIVNIDSPQCSLTCRDGQLVCKTDEGERRLPLEDVASIIITSFSAQIHSELFLQAAKHGVALVICESFKPISLVMPANRSTDTLLTRAQISLPPRSRELLWQKTVDAKCQNQCLLAEHIVNGSAPVSGAENLQNSAGDSRATTEARDCRPTGTVNGSASIPLANGGTGVPPVDQSKSSTGTDAYATQNPDPLLALLRETAFGKKPHKEAICAKLFWQVVGRSLNDPDFVRQRAGGGLNNLLNYGYAVLLSTVLQKLFGVGLDPTFGISHVARERSTPLAYDLMEPFRPCVDWRVYQWAKQHPNKEDWQVSKGYRQWVTRFPLERVEYLDFTLEIQSCIEGVVRSFRRAVLNNKPSLYKPWTQKNSKWAG